MYQVIRYSLITSLKTTTIEVVRGSKIMRAEQFENIARRNYVLFEYENGENMGYEDWADKNFMEEPYGALSKMSDYRFGLSWRDYIAFWSDAKEKSDHFWLRY